jgi:hypothetical protein
VRRKIYICIYNIYIFINCIGNLFDEYKFYLVGIAIGIIILGLSYFYAKRRHPKVKYSKLIL